jgi:hypothetical protein
VILVDTTATGLQMLRGFGGGRGGPGGGPGGPPQ